MTDRPAPSRESPAAADTVMPPVPAAPRILHIDDDEANRYAVSRLLRQAGFDVVEGGTGRAAIELASTAAPDLAILDIRLPDMSGFDVCRHLKADPRTADVPVLHLSASLTTGADKATGLDGGADGYLIRPVEPIELIATVNALLRQRRAEADLRRTNAALAEANDALRAEEARSRFLAELGDATRDLDDPEAVMAEVARRLGTHLRTSRCAYADVESDGDRFTILQDYTAPGVASSAGHFRLNAFGPRAAGEMRAGRTLVVRDVDAEFSAADGAAGFASIGVKAIICCPLLKVGPGEGGAGRLVAMMAVHQSAARDWTAAEVELVREVVERSWAYLNLARARRSLAESDDRFRRVIEGVRDYAILTFDSAGTIATWNVGAERVLGYAEQEIVGRPAAELFTEEDRAAGVPEREMATAARDGHAPDVRWHQKKDGTRFFVDGILSAIRDPAGKLIGYSKLMRDVTERWKAEEALRASERRFRQMADAAPAMLWVTDVNGMCTFLSRGWYEYTGQAEAEGLGLGWTNAAHPDDRAEAGKAFLAASAVKRDYSIDFRLRRADGAYRWVIDAGRPRYDAEGAFVGFVGSVIDIDDRKRAEDDVRLSEARFRQLADAMPQIVFAARPDGHVDYYNGRWYEYTGFPADGSTGDASWVAVHEPSALERVSAVWGAAVRAGTPYEIEYKLRRGSDGALRWHLGRALPVRDDRGTIVRWFGTNTDVHDQKMLLEQNQELLGSERAARAAAEDARASAETANRLKDEFLATLSHELRTPLNAIVGWAGVLASLRRDDPDLAEGLTAIDRNARVQAQLIEDLLDVSRIISGKLRLDVQRIELAPVIDAAIASVYPAAQNKGIRIQKVLDPKASAVWGDPGRLQQVVWNLLSNAIKFTPKDGRVQIALAGVNSHVELTVSDTGRGIKPSFLPYVFERFRQADASTTRAHGGLGLGLAIVKHLVELHGGTVHVSSEGEGKGASFVVKLPLSVLDGPTDEAAVNPRAARLTGEASTEACPEPNLDGVRALVVDDEPDARKLMRRFLEACDVVVTTAASVDEAIAAVGAGRFDVIVSDIGMPDRDGYDFIRAVRSLSTADGGDTPAIALTAFARTEDRRRALMAGFQIHLPKPVDPAELLTVIAGVTGRTKA